MEKGYATKYSPQGLSRKALATFRPTKDRSILRITGGVEAARMDPRVGRRLFPELYGRTPSEIPQPPEQRKSPPSNLEPQYNI